MHINFAQDHNSPGAGDYFRESFFSEMLRECRDDQLRHRHRAPIVNKGYSSFSYLVPGVYQ
jgi:hypothetical protein